MARKQKLYKQISIIHVNTSAFSIPSSPSPTTPNGAVLNQLKVRVSTKHQERVTDSANGFEFEEFWSPADEASLKSSSQFVKQSEKLKHNLNEADLLF